MAYKNKNKEKQNKKAYYKKNRYKILKKSKNWYEKNKNRKQKQNKKWKEQNQARVNENNKKWYEKNKNRISEQRKKYREQNKDRIKEQRKKYYEQNKDKIKKYEKKYREQNKDRRRKNEKKRMSIPIYKLNKNISSGIYKTLKYTKRKRGNRRWEALVGYTVYELVNHLKSKFDKYMDWDNYGSYWVVDHIIPLNYFKDKYQSPNDIAFKIAWSLRNLRPLEKTENLKKNAKLNYQKQII